MNSPPHGSSGEPTFARDLGLFDATMIGVGAMIGAGIFVLTGIAAGESGPASILAFALNGAVTLLTAFAYAELAAAIPENVRQAAQSSEWAPEVLFYSLLDNNREIREQQLLLIAKTMGHDSEAQVRALVQSGGVPSDSQRLPLLELGFTALKRRPAEFISKMLNTVDKLVRLDGRIDVFEYLLARLIAQYLWESQNPKSARLAGSKRLSGQQQSCREVLAVLARHGAGKSVLDNARTEQGSSGSRNGPEAAYRAGLEVLGLAEDSDMPRVSDWAETLDNILPALDRLRASDKEKLVKAMVTTVSHDGQLLPQELELLRVVCSLIHVPLPLLNN